MATSQLRLHHDMISSTEGTGAQRMDESGAPSTRNPGFGVRGGPPPRGRPSESGTAAEDPIRCCARTIQSPGPPGLARTSTSHRPAHSAIGRIFFSIIRSTPWHRGVPYHAESTPIQCSSAQGPHPPHCVRCELLVSFQPICVGARSAVGGKEM